MALTNRQRMLLHVVVRRFDRAAEMTYLDPLGLEDELGAELPELAGDVDVLEAEGYLERLADEEADNAGWTVRPTDKGILAAMGLGE